MPGDQGDFSEGANGVKDFFLSIPQSIMQSWFMRFFGGEGRQLKENLLEAHDRIGDAIKKATDALQKGYVEVNGQKIKLSEGQKVKLKKELEKLHKEQKALLKKLSGKSIASIEATPADKDAFDEKFLSRPGVRTREQKDIDDLTRKQMRKRREARGRTRDGISESQSRIRSKNPSHHDDVRTARKRRLGLAEREKYDEVVKHRYMERRGGQRERVRGGNEPTRSRGVCVKRDKTRNLGAKVASNARSKTTTLHVPRVGERVSVREKLRLLSKLSQQVEICGGLRRALRDNPRLAAQIRGAFGIKAGNVEDLAKNLRGILGSRSQPSRDRVKDVAKGLKIMGGR